MESHILVKYASRSRPARFMEGLDSIIDLCNNTSRMRVVAILDKDDPFERDYRQILDRIKYKDVFFDFGVSTSKIDAINRNSHPLLDWHLLVNFSDDMRFVVYGWDTLIRDGFRCNGDDLFLHFPDSTAKGMLSTMSIIDRKYFDRDGYIYHPSYKSLWCDNEAQDVAQIRGRYRYMGTQIFDHYHPAYGMAEWDEQYQRQQKDWDADEKNYYYRKSNNFFLDEAKHIDSDSCTKEGTV